MTIRLHIFSRELLFVLLAVYFAQGSFYAAGSVISRLTLLLVLSLSLFYLIKSLCLRAKKGLFYYALCVLLLLNSIGFIICGNFEGIHFSEFRNILTALLPFFPFYYFSHKGYLTEKHLLRFFVLLLPVAIATFYSSQSNILIEQLDNSENVVNNAAYLFVALIPYIFLLGKHKILSAISFFLILFFIIQSAKRGALIISLACSLLFAYYQLRIVDPKEKVRNYILALIGISLLSIFLFNFYISNEFLISRMERIFDGGSGRDVIYIALTTSWYESNSIVNYLFGFGFASTIEHSGGLLAHNDWLELLINFGLLGVFIYLLVFYDAMRFVLSSKIEIRYRIIMLTIILLWFFQTLFSMFYTASTSAFVLVMLGYLFGTYQRQKTTTCLVETNEDFMCNR